MQLTPNVPDRVSAKGAVARPNQRNPDENVGTGPCSRLCAGRTSGSQRHKRHEVTSTTSKAFWYWDRIDEISRDVSGFGDMHVSFDDNADEWASLLGYDSANILGFMTFVYPPLFHRILMGPSRLRNLHLLLRSGVASG